MALTTLNNNSLVSVTALPSAITTGKVLQVVQGSYSTQVEVTSSSHVPSGLQATITPVASSSKIFISCFASSIAIASTGGHGFHQCRFYRNVNSGGDTAIGDFWQLSKIRQDPSYNQEAGGSGGANYLDTPTYTLGNSIVYKLYHFNGGANAVRICNEGLGATLTLFEVGA